MDLSESVLSCLDVKDMMALYVVDKATRSFVQKCRSSDCVHVFQSLRRASSTVALVVRVLQDINSVASRTRRWFAEPVLVFGRRLAVNEMRRLCALVGARDAAISSRLQAPETKDGRHCAVSLTRAAAACRAAARHPETQFERLAFAGTW
jgi:hypothetical protein